MHVGPLERKARSQGGLSRRQAPRQPGRHRSLPPLDQRHVGLRHLPPASGLRLCEAQLLPCATNLLASHGFPPRDYYILCNIQASAQASTDALRDDLQVCCAQEGVVRGVVLRVAREGWPTVGRARASPASQALQQLEVAGDEGFLLGARPAFQLAFASEGRERCRVFFTVDQADRSAVACEGARAAVLMTLETVSQVQRLADVEAIVGTAKDVDEMGHHDDDGIVGEAGSSAKAPPPV